MKKPFWILWVVWLVLNVVTAVLMEMHADESYYWLWSKHMAWGYRAHPPMVALWIGLSKILLPIGNLQVRIVTVLCHGLTVLGLGAIVKERLESRGFLWDRGVIYTFYVIAGSLAMFNAAGFMTTPDAPLLLFGTGWLWAFQRYLKAVEERHAWMWAGVLGIMMALMVYSKYMAVLFLLFAAIAYPQWVRDRKIWSAIVLAVLLLIPHIVWQVRNGFPSFQLQVIARSMPFKAVYMAEYIPNQMVVYNPIVWAAAMILALRYLWSKKRTKDIYTRVLAWEIVGFSVFFGLMTARGHVEPHWTMVSSLAMIISGCEWYCCDSALSTKQNKWFRGGVFTCLGLVLVMRVLLCLNVLPIQTGLAHKKDLYDRLYKEAKGEVMVFSGSFGPTAMYNWFEPSKAVLLHDMRASNHTEFETWHEEIAYQGQAAYLMTGRHVRHLQSTDALQMRIDSLWLDDGHCYFRVTATNPFRVAFLWQHAEMPPRAQLISEGKNGYGLLDLERQGCDTIPALGTEKYVFSVPEKDIPIGQKVCIGIDNGFVLTQNTAWINL